MTAAGVVRGLRSLAPSLEDYRLVPTTWRPDLLAGLTVGVVALPLALAFGISSGAGPQAGLVTAIVAGVVAAVFGGSAVQVSGPTGAMVVVLAPIIAAHGVGSVALLSVMAGALVVVAGVLRVGRVIAYLPWPVIEGFTLGIAIVIALQQVPTALAGSAHSTNSAVAAVQAVGSTDPTRAAWALGAAAVVAVLMEAGRRFAPRFPSSIVAVAAVTLLAMVLSAPLATIGRLPAGLPTPAVPHGSAPLMISLLGPACTVAALAAIESLLSGRVAASMADNGPFDADRELVGQGLASIAAGFFGGMPATGAIARTAVNVRSGARSRLAALTHALVLLVLVLFAGSLVAHIPLAALAGVLIVTATRMISRHVLRAVLGAGPGAVVTCGVTAIVTVSLDLVYAVAIGVVVAVVLAMRALARTNVAHREQLPDTRPGDERIALFRIDGSLFFGAGERISESIGAAWDVEVVILRLSQLQLFDATGARQLAELVQQLERRGITVILKGIRPEHRKLAVGLGVVSSLRHRAHLTTDLESAVSHARSHVARAAAGG
ncbi:MAG: SulP family inorganic anion transporter [Nakamurella sp.]